MIEEQQQEHLYTIKELCDIFQITRKTLNNWMAKGFPHYKIFNGSVRFNKHDIDTWLEKQKKNKR